MIIIDTSAWIEYLGDGHAQTCEKVDRALSEGLVCIGDLIYCEIMQGIYDRRQQQDVSALLLALPQMEMVGFAMAAKSSQNYRILRSKGITVRKTIDVLIATFCTEYGHELIHFDRDFDLMAPHIGLTTI